MDDSRPTFTIEDDPDGTNSLSPVIVRRMTDEDHTKMVEKKKARRLQKQTGMKYTEALRKIQAEKENN